MKTNLAYVINETPETWKVQFMQVNLVTLSERRVKGKVIEGESRVRLITRSGFEQKHIVTSQIASM